MFLLVYLVLCLVLTKIAMHPLISNDDNEELEDINNEINDPSNDGIIFNLPTNMNDGFTMIINGILNTNDKTFTLVLPMNKNDKKDLRMIFNFNEKTIVTLKAAEFTSIATDRDHESIPYDLKYGKNNDLPTFTVRVVVRAHEEKHILDIYFEGNEAGETLVCNCLLDNIESISQVIMKQGVQHIRKLIFEFNP